MTGTRLSLLVGGALCACVTLGCGGGNSSTPAAPVDQCARLDLISENSSGGCLDVQKRAGPCVSGKDTQGAPSPLCQACAKQVGGKGLFVTAIRDGDVVEDSDWRLSAYGSIASALGPDEEAECSRVVQSAVPTGNICSPSTTCLSPPLYAGREGSGCLERPIRTPAVCGVETNPDSPTVGMHLACAVDPEGIPYLTNLPGAQMLVGDGWTGWYTLTGLVFNTVDADGDAACRALVYGLPPDWSSYAMDDVVCPPE